MTLPDATRKYVSELFNQRIEAGLTPKRREYLRLRDSFRGNSVTLHEDRPRMLGQDGWSSLGVALFRLNPTTGTWSLYWRDSRERWLEVEEFEPSIDLGELLDEVDQDPSHLFWG
jgi:hypothetical protein